MHFSFNTILVYRVDFIKPCGAMRSTHCTTRVTTHTWYM